MRYLVQTCGTPGYFIAVAAAAVDGRLFVGAALLSVLVCTGIQSRQTIHHPEANVVFSFSCSARHVLNTSK